VLVIRGLCSPGCTRCASGIATAAVDAVATALLCRPGPVARPARCPPVGHVVAAAIGHGHDVVTLGGCADADPLEPELAPPVRAAHGLFPVAAVARVIGGVRPLAGSGIVAPGHQRPTPDLGG
jgi:hypothetical protein